MATPDRPTPAEPWIEVAAELPPENEVVETVIDDGRGRRNEWPLKRQGRHWWLPDGSMYVYYTPTHWRRSHGR